MNASDAVVHVVGSRVLCAVMIVMFDVCRMSGMGLEICGVRG